jgi:hypothetical protein
MAFCNALTAAIDIAGRDKGLVPENSEPQNQNTASLKPGMSDAA